MKYEEDIARQLVESMRLKEDLLEYSRDLISEIARVVVRAYKKGNKVVWFGNGGSAADAQHLAGELLGKFYLKREPLASMALNTNTSVLTALGNDFGFETIFQKQVRALVRRGDVVVGLSTSGTSPNVILALEEAKRKGAITVGLTGKSGGKMKGLVDYLIPVTSTDTPRIQEAHITIGHIICSIVEKELFGSKK